MDSWKYVNMMDTQAVTTRRMTNTADRIPYSVYKWRPHSVRNT
jgi:hypothetical protein